VFISTQTHCSVHNTPGDAHCTENPIYVFTEIKLCGFVPNYYIHASMSDLYIPRIGLPIWLHECGNWKTKQYTSVLEITRQRSFISGYMTECIGSSICVCFCFQQCVYQLALGNTILANLVKMYSKSGSLCTYSYTHLPSWRAL
jgi:hypothetical protein